MRFSFSIEKRRTWKDNLLDRSVERVAGLVLGEVIHSIARKNLLGKTFNKIGDGFTAVKDYVKGASQDAKAESETKRGRKKAAKEAEKEANAKAKAEAEAAAASNQS